jgi:hypothetical protein
MTKKTTQYDKVLRVYLSAEEFTKMATTSKQTSCRSMSEYGRKMLFRKPITMLYRNQTADDALELGIESLQILIKLLDQPTLSEQEKALLRNEIQVLEDVTTKILDLCSQR